MASKDLELNTPSPGHSEYNITVDALVEMMKDYQNTDHLKKNFGSIQELASLLKTDLRNGLAGDEVETDFQTRSAYFGFNVLPEQKMTSIWSMILNALKEPIIILLIIAAVVSLIFGIFVPRSGASADWIEGLAIIIAVCLVIGVTCGNDYQKEKKFRELNAVKNDKRVKVRRAGKEEQISIMKVQVGDVVLLDSGDSIPADGVFIEGHELSADEATMNGETEPQKKNTTKYPLLSGCEILTGSGSMLVVAVGPNSQWGKIYMKLNEAEDEQTPMQEKLGDLAKLIGYIGMGVAALLFIILTIKFIVVHTTSGEKFQGSMMREFIQFVILCITIIVVAVPEGLPLAVTIALAYSQKAMLKDNLLVRHMAACETMGGATTICSDKTGTLTENLMTVTRTWFGGQTYEGELEETLGKEVDKKMLELLSTAISCNSTGFLRKNETKGRPDFIGNKTECALLVLCNKIGHDYDVIRKSSTVITTFPFSSERKKMSTLIDNDKGSRLFTKGASEIILGLCDTYVDASGKPTKLSKEDVANLEKTINAYAADGLRTLSIAYRDLDEKTDKWEVPPEDHLTLIAIVGIEDPLRKEVPEAVRKCKGAGVTVRMVTGDNKLTASKIAQDCGILYEEDHVVLEGPVFRKMSDSELDAIMPKLRVLARSSPSDKERLVERLRFHREVVAVTGDGTNDGLALKAADVGFAMGIAGTDVAKKACDIIVMDDNFASIVKAVMWGRCVRENVQKFLQFQMTVNAVALVIAFVSAVSAHGEPLTPIQLLFVNLIQDTFGALALATEKPTEDLLQKMPTGRRERLLTPRMWRNIGSSALYCLAILFAIVYAGGEMFNITEDAGVNIDHDFSIRFTIVFNAFVLMTLFNEINARRNDDHWNAFEGFFTNWIFLGVVIGTAAIQAIIISVGSVAFQVVYLNYKYWFICMAIGLSMLPFGVIQRTLIPVPDYDWIKYERPSKKKKKKHDSAGSEDDVELRENRKGEKSEKMETMELP